MPSSSHLRAGAAGLAAPWIVLIVGIVLSAVAWKWTADQVEARSRATFEEATLEIRNAIQSRLTSYIDVLYGLQGLFHASPEVSRMAFHRYANSLGLAHRYPQVRSVTFSPSVQDASKAQFERLVRADASLDPGGNADFAIRPEGRREWYVPLTYIEPMQLNRGAFGFDLASEPVRRATVERARDSGRAVASERVLLQSDPAQGAGVVLRLAVYRPGNGLDTVEERRRAFVGLVGITVRIRDVVEDILANTLTGDVSLKIVEAASQGASVVAAGTTLFESEPRSAPGHTFRQSRSLDFGGRQWDLDFSAPRARFDTSGNVLPSITLALGLALSFLFAGFVFSLTSASRRAVRIAEHITRDLRDSETRLAEAQRRTQELIEVLPNPIFFKGTDGKYLGVNKAWESFFGIARGEFLGKTVHDLYPHDRGLANRLHAMDEELWRRPGAQSHEATLTKRGGERREAVYYKATYADAAGRVAGLIGTIIDVTERKRLERRYRDIFDQAAVGIAQIEVDGRFSDVNQRFCDMLGYGREELLRKSKRDVTHPEDLEEGARQRAAVAAGTQASCSAEMRYIRADGEMLWARRTLSAARDEGGRILYFISVVEDISERKRTERLLAMEIAVTRVIAESKTLEDAIPLVLEKFCVSMGWACGACWHLDPATNMLNCLGTWGEDNDKAQDFVAAIEKRSTALEPVSEGLLRRTYGTRQPVWIEDVARETGFRRQALAVDAGLHTAFAFPLMSASEVIGVMEFFNKGTHPPDHMLIRAVQTIGSQMGQYLVRMHAEQALKFVATHDGLTNLPNRAIFIQRLGHAIAQAQRHGRRLSVLFVDLDRFKVINDTLGHDLGDELLREMAARMKANVREADTVARLGGDEFVVLLEEIASPTTVRRIARKLLTALGKGVFIASRELNITASIGVSTYPEDGEDAQTLLKNADIAMYRAKDRGRNTFQFYSAELNVHTIEHLTLETDLRRALEREELLLHYQPQFDVSNGRLTGFEALVRWRHPERGLVPPAEFIPMAEETGLIVPIGEWVLLEACTMQRAWEDVGYADVRISVNLSARQIMKRDLLKDVARILRNTRCTPTSLDLEITESMVMHSPDLAAEFLGQLKEMGVEVTMDDFGTGYSSLAYIQRLPIDRLKIDRSFIAEIPHQAGSMAITRAVIAMAQSLRLTVIAEGVETREQIDFLSAHGCHHMQGFYFGRPMSEEHARALLPASRAVASRRA